MAIRLKLTKKWKIAIIVIFVLILGGSGGYLLWRTNQPDTVAPQDSEAGSQGNGACYYCCEGNKPTTCTPAMLAPGAVGGWQCDTSGNIYCARTQSPYCSGDRPLVTCGDGAKIPVPSSNKNVNDKNKDGKIDAYDYCPDCNHAAPDNNEPIDAECNVGSQCDEGCIWPEVNYCKSDGTCTCKSGSDNGCKTTTPCEPVCPSGYKKCTSSDCGSDTKIATCTDKCDGCNNKYTNQITCKKDTTNTCDGGEWLTKPTGTYKYCDPITYMAKAKDKDGIDKTSVVAKINNVKSTKFLTNNATETSLIITEQLSTATECLPVGSYTVNLSWEDKKGASSTACTLSTTFKIAEEDVPEVYPEWSITKTGAEQCIESGDAQVAYTIKVKNSGEGAGNIEKIVDVLDSKVLASYISGTISEEGLFGSGKITWEMDQPTGEGLFASGEERTYTYTLVIPKTAFGKYTNTVTAYPTEEDEFSDTLEVTVDCEQDIPQTGLFDSTVAKIVAGIVLLLLGFNLHRVDTSFRRVQNSLNKLSISIQDSQDERRKRNFEKKIVKK